MVGSNKQKKNECCQGEALYECVIYRLLHNFGETLLACLITKHEESADGAGQNRLSHILAFS
jgi:hypothetical protein